MEGLGKISVLMGIYNCADTLEAAVRSIQNQTYTDWELILCDDGSEDETLTLAHKIAEEDDRIIVISNGKNCGLNRTLNHCLSKASGEFIARMDGDDECDPLRFEKQIIFLTEHREFDIVSTAMSFFDENGEWGRNHVSAEPGIIDIVLSSPICHAPMMTRKHCMDAVDGYTEDPRMLRVEDVNLWIKLYLKGYRCFNIDDTLYRMRNDQNAVNRRKYRYRINESYVRLKGCRQFHLGAKAYLIALKPLIAGLIPAQLRMAIRKRQWKS